MQRLRTRQIDHLWMQQLCDGKKTVNKRPSVSAINTTSKQSRNARSPK